MKDTCPFTFKIDQEVKKDNCPFTFIYGKEDEQEPIIEQDNTPDLSIIESSITNIESSADMTFSNIIETVSGVKCPFTFDTEYCIPEVDGYHLNNEDMLFRITEDHIYVPLHVLYGNYITDNIDYFDLESKRCYKGLAVRQHLVHYINYFEKYFDPHHELYIAYGYIKYMIDYEENYDKETFFRDLLRYIFNPVMLQRIKLMVEHNYRLNLNNGKRTNNVSLQYTDYHALLLLNFSMMQKLSIPLLTHFIGRKKYNKKNLTNTILMEFYYRLFDMFKSINIVAKLYETVMSSVKKSMRKNKLWDMQNIRGINATTHSIEGVENIALQLSPKYTFKKHIISFNFKAIKRGIGYKVLEISYGITYVPLSSSIRDEDNNSKIDKYEANLEKTDENLHLFIKANKVNTLKHLMNMNGIGLVSEDEIAFYKQELTKNGGELINRFQQDLVNLSVDKYFGDPITSKFTNKNEYVAMMIATKKLLKTRFILLPEIICGRILKLVDRKSINKKYLEKVKLSPTWKRIENLYRNPLKEDQVLSNIAVILNSEFAYISYEDRYLNGTKIVIQPDILYEEFLEFILYCAEIEDGNCMV